MQGIYLILNKINNKIYIGQSFNILKRWNKHTSTLNSNKHHNIHLQKAWNKYGSNNFEFSIIEECEKELLNEREIYWINYYKSYDINNGYNLTFGGSNGSPNEETKKKISEGNKGKIYSEVSKKKMSEAQKGRKISNEHKQKLSDALKGRETWNKGKTYSIGPMSEETKQNISKAKKGKQSHITISDKDIPMILKKIEQGEKVNDLAIKFNVKPTTIYSLKRRAKKIGIEFNNVNQHLKIPLEQIPLIINRINNGENINIIAKEYNCSIRYLESKIKTWN